MKSLATTCLILVLSIHIATSKSNNAEKRKFRIVNGVDVSHTHFPYHVGINSYTMNNEEGCAGALITPNYVLTAAHCLEDKNASLVIAGSQYGYRSNVTEETAQYIGVSSEYYYIHPEYTDDQNRSMLIHDIALILLPVAFTLNENVTTIDLPTNETYDNELATLAGWGDVDDNQTLPSTLQYMNAAILPLDKCERFVGKLDFTKICLDVSTGQAACYGDSGGPLVVERNGRLVLVGLVSQGDFTYENGTCEAFTVDVYTRVSPYLEWINQIMSDNEEDN